MKMLFHYFTLFKDALFPIFCLGCEKEGIWVCDTCRAGVAIAGVFACPVCHAAQPKGECCAPCKSQSYLTSEIALTPYEEKKFIGTLIHTFKYNGVEAMIQTFEEYFKYFFLTRQELVSSYDIVMPIPLHMRRYAERSFNQSELIARSLSKLLNIPFSKMLTRKIYTRPQATLNREEREKNMEDAFRVREKEKIRGTRILLVDDVYTTGATLQSAARVLLRAGAKEVGGFTLARG